MITVGDYIPNGYTRLQLKERIIEAKKLASHYDFQGEFRMFYLRFRNKGNSVMDSITYALSEWDII